MAFSGQMRYLPTGSWLNPHQVRLAWVVQALVTDMPCDKTVDTSADCQADGYQQRTADAPDLLRRLDADRAGTCVRTRHRYGHRLRRPAVDDNVKG